MADVAATVAALPCTDGICMKCNQTPSLEEILNCKTCTSPWHVSCLSVPPDTVAEALDWECPDCTPAEDSVKAAINSVGDGSDGGLVAAIKALEADESLTEREKARKRQALVSKTALVPSDGDGAGSEKKMDGGNEALLRSFCCTICMRLPERPVTVVIIQTPCGHNFCLKCYDRYVAQGKRRCANCRQPIPTSLKINDVLVRAIRRAKVDKTRAAGEGQRPVTHYLQNQDRPDKPFRSERAKKSGNANASSGRIFVTTAGDHFGPITAEYDPERNEGVLVGRSWVLQMECRQWGIHRSPVAGICGQANHGAQSVILSGGYEDDEDHGEWFIYTGCGGRDLSGNKRTNKEHNCDQEFESRNEALRLSCRMGYPVRVVRSHKENSSYSPREEVLRYDGVYRIEKCWRKKGAQGFKVCRFLFVRCDNEPALWTCDVQGDRPRPLPVIKELNNATDITERKGSPSWDFDEEKECWMWKKPPPLSKQRVKDSGVTEEGKKMNVKRVYRRRQKMEEEIRADFGCHICHEVLAFPVTTPCAHNFCKACLEGAFVGRSCIQERTCQGRRTLRPKKNAMNCPLCSTDIAEFLQNLQVNTELMNAIQEMQKKLKELEEEEEAEEVAAQESEEIANADKETVDEAKESISPAPETETAPQACEKEPTHKRKTSEKMENVADAGVTVRRSKKGKTAAAAAV